MDELAQGRDFNLYARLMDASLVYKQSELRPHVLPGLIVDCGFGTGGLLKVLSDEFPHSQFVGVDFSTEFTLRAHELFLAKPNVRIVRGDVRFLDKFGIKDATTVILASLLHEVHSYNGYDETPVRETLLAAYKVLKSNGRLLIRDGIAPSRAVVALWCNHNDGLASGSTNELSTRAIFEKFSREYRHGTGIPVDLARLNGLPCFLLRARDAYEFMSKKDYREHWGLEINEEYGFWRRREWESALEQIGFRNIQIQEETNPWVVENRFQGHVVLYDPITGLALPFFPTHTVIVAEK